MEIEIKAQEIKIVDIDSIQPWKKNANKHPDSQIDGLIEQYKFNGFSGPLEVEEGSNDIVAGCGRWMAAKKAGMKKVSVYFRTYETYSHKYARMVADNATQRQSTLDLSEVHLNLEDLHLPSIDILAIHDFQFEPSNTEVEINEKELDENIPTDKECPSCGYKW